MSVTKMKDGKRWYVYCRYKDWQGQTHAHKKEGFTKKSEALQYEREFLAKKQGSAEMTVQALYESYMDFCEPRVRPTVYKNKQCIFRNQILPYMQGRRVCDVDSADIIKWQTEILKKPGYSKSYHKTIQRQMSALWNFAVGFCGLRESPCKGVASMGKNARHDMEILTTEQLTRLLDAVNDDTARLLISTLYWSGLRVGELLALTPADVKRDPDRLVINKTYTRLHGEDLIQDTKTEGSTRVVKMPAACIVPLLDFVSRQYGMGEEDRIFHGWDAQRLRYRLDRATAAAGLPDMRIHDLRHSHASLLIKKGYSPVAISKRLGHDKVSTTLDIYGHLYPSDEDEIVADLQRSAASLRKCNDSATPRTA